VRNQRFWAFSEISRGRVDIPILQVKIRLNFRTGKGKFVRDV